jgi:hypothetical protein
MGHSFLYARQNTGLLWHTAVRPSVHASCDNISHLFPLLLIGHITTYIVLIKGGASERCDFSQFGKRQFSYGIYNWLVKKMQHINYCYHAEKLTFNCHKGGRIMAKLFILSYSDAVSFRDIRGHLGTITSIVTFLYMRLT